MRIIPNRTFHLRCLCYSRRYSVLQRLRYGLDCTIGRRLAEDYALMSHMAYLCGLQEEINRGVGRKTFGEQLRVDLTLTLVALTLQETPWKARPGMLVDTNRASHLGLELFEHNIFFYGASLYVQSSVCPVIDFLYAVESAGMPITLSIRSPEFPYKTHLLPLPPQMERFRQSDHQAWYESKEYSRLPKTESWWPYGKGLCGLAKCKERKAKGSISVDYLGGTTRAPPSWATSNRRPVCFSILMCDSWNANMAG